VAVYVGEVIGSREAERRRRRYKAQGRRHVYMMSVVGDEVVDATVRGGVARFANHSCAPNCVSEKWSVAGETLVGLFATRNVAEGEEITYNYRFTWFGEAAMACECGAASCNGTLGRVIDKAF
jgi:SET domain-containing protein